jgi:hypothetical protein
VVRRLPVIQTKDAADAAAEARPPWHWVLIGAGLVFTIWIPLAMLALWLGRALVTSFEPEPLLGALFVLIPVISSFSLACLSGGALVGRFGGRAAAREAALAGVLAAFAAWIVALSSGALAPFLVAVTTALLLPTLAGLLAWLGGRIGVARRPR